jgi:hypothetical protein
LSGFTNTRAYKEEIECTGKNNTFDRNVNSFLNCAGTGQELSIRRSTSGEKNGASFEPFDLNFEGSEER